MSDAPPASPPTAGYGGSAVVTALVGGVFLMFGWPFAQWLLTPTGNPYSIEWTQGPLAGRPVAYFELTGGTAWRDLAQFATGVVLLIEATLYAVLAFRPTTGRTPLALVLGLAGLGCLINLLSAAMQLWAGFYQPIFAIIGLAVCAVSGVSAWHRLRERMTETRTI